MNPESRTLIAADLRTYGAALSDYGEIVSPVGKLTGVSVAVKRGRILCESRDGTRLLFSGRIEAGTVAAFCQKYWYWVPICTE